MKLGGKENLSRCTHARGQPIMPLCRLQISFLSKGPQRCPPQPHPSEVFSHHRLSTSQKCRFVDNSRRASSTASSQENAINLTGNSFILFTNSVLINTKNTKQSRRLSKSVRQWALFRDACRKLFTISLWDARITYYCGLFIMLASADKETQGSN